MHFKKLATLLLTVCMIASSLVGCASGSNSSTAPSAAAPSSAAPSAEPAAPAEEPSGDTSLTGKRVRVVIGSTSTGGDSYMVADMVTRYLGEEMGFNGKVDPVGNAAALDAISKAKGDGTTIMMFHDMTFLSVLFGAVDEKYALENLTVGPRIGQNPGGCYAAHKDAPYSNLKEAAEWLKANPSEIVRINIESGGASHLTFAAYWLWVNETYGEEVSSRVKAIVGGSTDEKKQRLWDGNTDVIYGDYSAFVEFTKEGVDNKLAMKMMDPADAIDGVDLATMAQNGVTFGGQPFVFSKDFAMYFPKDMDEAVLNEIAAAMQRVAANPNFQAEMAKLKYKTVSPEETELSASQQFIFNKREMSKALIEAAPSLDDLT
ncbi:MAG: tripartite tricarboxylate transporter substrate-binding protein [Oscillospiraceae bacterium]|jgi:tripartite-type tricarboxylate transporter receptor subunit TctC